MAKRLELSVFSFTAWLFQSVIYYFCRWYFFRHKGWSVTARTDLKQVRKPLILAAAPHLSHTDVVVVPASIPSHLLPVRWLADSKIFTGRIKSLWLKLWGAIPVERDPSGSFECEDIQQIVDYARKGKCIGVFPECCLVGGRFGDPQRDLIVTALDKSICVLPVALTGIERQQKLLPLNRVTQQSLISIGHPLSDATELLDEITR
jgi:1-acyl-sn-glycerol-3-phosphate acyltransferase